MGQAKFYKSDTIWIYNEGVVSSVDSAVPSGNYRRTIKGTKVSITGLNNESHLFSPAYIEITEIQKSGTPDDNYTNVAEFITATNTFFAGTYTKLIDDAGNPIKAGNPLAVSPQESIQLGSLLIPFSDIESLVRASADLDGTTSGDFETLERNEVEYSVPTGKQLIVAITTFSCNSKEGFSFGYADDNAGANYVELISEGTLIPQSNYTGQSDFLYVIPEDKFPIVSVLANISSGFMIIEALEKDVEIVALQQVSPVRQSVHISPFSITQNVNTVRKTTDPVIAKFNQVQENTTLAVAAAINDWSIELDDITGAVDGSYIILFDPIGVRFSTFYQVGSAVGNVISLSSPIDFAYPIGTFIDIAITNMAIDGSVTPQIFGLRGVGAPEGIELTFSLTRIIISCLCDSAVSLDKFGNISALEKGLTLRSRNGQQHNIWNARTNRDIDSIFGGDWKPYQAIPPQGQDGFTARLSFDGDDKLGVAGNLPIGNDWEVVQPEDLTDITLLEFWGEGHVTVK